MEEMEGVNGGRNDCEKRVSNTVCESGRGGPTLDDLEENGDGFASWGLID